MKTIQFPRIIFVHMKKVAVFLVLLVLLNLQLQAQAPQGFNFQGIALDSAGFPLASKPVLIRFSISADSLGNSVSYRETAGAQTDKYGQFTAVIGNGMPSIGRFSSILWSTGSVYLKTEIDITNTGKYVVTGLSKLLSVPYALQATTAGNILSDIYGNTKAGSSALENPKPQTTTGNVAVGDSALKYSNGLNNTAIGSRSMLKNNSASQNTAVGSASLYSNTTGGSNSALGFSALGSNTTGSFNTASGFYSLGLNKTGNYNTAIGYNTGGKLTTGDKNIFIGNDAANNNNFKTTSNKLVIQNDSSLTPLIYGEFDNKKLTINGDLLVTGKMTGSLDFLSDDYGNTKAGSSALNNNKISSTTGTVAIGDSALKYNYGRDNTAIGSRSMQSKSISSGGANTAIGNSSLYSITSGVGNTASGASALLSNTTGSANVASGNSALYNNTTGSYNIAYGNGSLMSNIIGNYNTAIGFTAGKLNVGDKNIFIGNSAGNNNNFKTTSNKLVIQNDSSLTPLIYGEFDNKKLTINGDFEVTGKVTASVDLLSDAYGNTKAGSSTLDNRKLGSTSGTVAVGDSALKYNYGRNNTAIGSRSMQSKTISSGASNTAIGNSSLYSNTSGNSNTASGASALYSNTTGSANTGSGERALFANTTGNYNTAIGNSAGGKLTTGNKNVFIGNDAGNNDEFSAVSNKLIIDNSSRADPLVMGDFTSRAMVINGDSSISKTATLEIKNGDTYISNSTKGIILTSPNGSCFRVTVGDDGSLVRTPVACPSYDISSNVSSVKMGTKVWTDKNLDVSTYRNGDTIPQVTNSGTWAGLTTGAWCWYNNDSANGATYGKLYNWYAINDPRGLAPKGWHIATGTEWDSLVGYLGSNDAGGKMKSTSNLWISPNVGATNSSGFSCLPGGFRADYGSFLYVGSVSWFTYNGNNLPVFLSLVSGSATTQPRNAFGYWNNLTEKSGVYVRCVKD